MNDQFKEPSGGGYGEGTGTAARMKEEVEGRASEVKQKLAELGRKAADQIDSQRPPVADTLNRTASTLHQQGDSAASVAHATADKLEVAADYVRGNDLKAMMGDVQDLAKRYPGQSLVAAAVVGFVLGRLLRSAD
jgi:ElaB/YqjD/DUF883 family membrane-anchored ribosome-binding protein